MFFTLYDKDSGKISATGFAPAGEAIVPRDESESVILRQSDLNTQYVQDGAIVDRPAMLARLVGKHLIGIPAPATIRINGRDYACADPIATLDFTYPGRYAITVSSWPYLDAQFEVVT